MGWELAVGGPVSQGSKKGGKEAEQRNTHGGKKKTSTVGRRGSVGKELDKGCLIKGG